MFRIFHRLRDKRGNVTMLWVAALPVFAILMMVIGTVAVAWMQHATAQTAADAASLAVTKKLDQRYYEELDRRLQELAAQGIWDPWNYLLGTPAKKESFMRHVVNKYQGELKSVAKEYVTKNGGDNEGTIRLSVSGRVEVTARQEFKPMIFEEAFEDTYIKGSGTGPSREHIKWLPEGAITLHFK